MRILNTLPIRGDPFDDGVTYNQACEEEQVLFTYLATLSHPQRGNPL